MVEAREPGKHWLLGGKGGSGSWVDRIETHWWTIAHQHAVRDTEACLAVVLEKEAASCFTPSEA
jgi:hypothetical protein